MWLKKANGVEHFFYYEIGGRRMGVYRRHDFSLPATGSGLSLERDEVYSAGKRIKSGPQAGGTGSGLNALGDGWDDTKLALGVRLAGSAPGERCGKQDCSGTRSG